MEARRRKARSNSPVTAASSGISLLAPRARDLKPARPMLPAREFRFGVAASWRQRICEDCTVDELRGKRRHSDPLRTISGDTNSVFTSWTRDPVVAAGFAGSGGVLVFKRIERSRPVRCDGHKDPMNPTIKSIQELLSAEGSDIAANCLRILQRGRPVLTSIEIPLKNARDIYLRRAALNADRGDPIQGFGELAMALRTEMTPSVGIHSIQVNSEQFSVFTTPDVSRLIGILLFPPNSSQD